MKTLRTLIIDDDIDWVKTFCDIVAKVTSPVGLAGAGYEAWDFRHVTNQEDATKAVAEPSGVAYDLILLDLNYPVDNSVPMPIERDTAKPLQGMVWLPELRRRQPKAAIVIITSYPEEEQLRNIVAAIKHHHANDFVPKTASFDDIVSRLPIAIQNERQRQRLLLLEKEWPLLGGIRAAKVIEEDVNDLRTKQHHRMDRIAQRIESGDPSAIAAAPDIIRAEIRAADKELDELTEMIDRRLNPGERQRQSVDLAELMQDLLLLYDPRLEEAGAKPAGPDSRAKLEVTTFVGDLKAALHEVITNAIESLACSSRPKVARTLSISVAPQGEKTMILVEDNGDGFSDEALANLFKLGKTTRNPHEHVGMGLYVARRAMIALGGDIKAENKPEGGARIQLFIPNLK